MVHFKQLLITSIALSILQGHSASPLVKRQTPTEIYVDDLGGLVAGVINTGLRSLTTLVSNGGLATRQLAADVGVSALPSILVASKSFNNIRSSGGILRNDGSVLLPNRANIDHLTTRVVLDVAPAVLGFSKVLDEQNGLFRIRPSGASAGPLPLGGGLLMQLLGIGNNGAGGSSEAKSPKTDLSKVPEPSFDDIPENVF